MNRDPFETGGIYHIYNRGTDKRVIFSDISDWRRFIHGLFEFNDTNPALNSFYKTESYEVQPRKKVVEILVYCLMPNHYHLMLRQITDGGITLFMRKLGTGYTMYYNKKNERSGALFQGRFKSVPVERNEQLRYLPHYIHANPLNPKKRFHDDLLPLLRWSSAPAFLNGHSDSICDMEFVRQLYPDGYRTAFLDWLAMRDESKLSGITLDS